MSPEPERGGALLRALSDLAERTAGLAAQVPELRADVDRVGLRIDEMVRHDGEVAVALERRLGALEAGLAAEQRERDAVWRGAKRLIEELSGRMREILGVRERVADRRRRVGVWLLDRFLVPLVCAAAGALAARGGWLP